MDVYKVSKAPPEAYYVTNFITEVEEQELLTNIYSAPKPKWTQLSNRRLQNWGGIPHVKGMIAEKMPAWLEEYLERIHFFNLMDGNRPNHVLINEYEPGQGIMPHFDGSLYYEAITTISLNSHTVLKFLQETDQNKMESVCSFLLEPRSLLVLKEDLFHKYQHTIEEVYEDIIDSNIVNLSLCSKIYSNGMKLMRIKPRISLTIRHVPKTSKFKLKF